MPLVHHDLSVLLWTLRAAADARMKVSCCVTCLWLVLLFVETFLLEPFLFMPIHTCTCTKLKIVLRFCNQATAFTHVIPNLYTLP